MSGSIPALQLLSSLLLVTIYKDANYYYPHFTAMETGAEKLSPCLSSRSWSVESWGAGPCSLAANSAVSQLTGSL